MGDAAWEGPFTIPAGSLAAGDNVLAVEVHQTSTGSSDIVFGCDLTTEPVAASAPYTPGAVNSVRTVLPAFPAVWLNEVLPQNVNGITDRFGDRDPWVELYSASTNACCSLGGFYLTDTYLNLTKWPFPAAVTLTNRQCLVVWLDGESGESINSELHTSFRLAAHAGTVALVWSNAGSVRALDYLNYSIPSADARMAITRTATSADGRSSPRRHSGRHERPDGCADHDFHQRVAGRQRGRHRRARQRTAGLVRAAQSRRFGGGFERLFPHRFADRQDEGSYPRQHDHSSPRPPAGLGRQPPGTQFTRR